MVELYCSARIFAAEMRLLLFLVIGLGLSPRAEAFGGTNDGQPTKYQYHRDSNAHRILTYGADFGSTVSFSGSSPNWSSGGFNNITANGFMSAFAQVKRPNTSFDNIFKVNLGMVSARQYDNFGIRYRVNKKKLTTMTFTIHNNKTLYCFFAYGHRPPVTGSPHRATSQ